jgi:hypothetical protein
VVASGLAPLLVGAAALIGGACLTESGAGNGGGGGSDGGDAGRERAGNGTACSPVPSGCFCQDSQAEPGTLDRCSTSSVVQAGGEQGLCCDSSPFCFCDAFVCRYDAALKYCQCGTSFSVTMIVQGTIVSECPAPAPSERCCLSSDTQGKKLCTCSSMDCDASTAVARCALADVAVCGAGEEVIAACM